MISLTKRQLS